MVVVKVAKGKAKEYHVDIVEYIILKECKEIDLTNSSKGAYLNGVPKTIHYFKLSQIILTLILSLSSQNGKSQTYCLATILTKTPNLREDLPHTTFRQLKKEEMTVPISCIYEA